MLFRYLVTRTHPQLDDVPMHVHADVCLHPILALSLDGEYAQFLSELQRKPVRILFRGGYLSSPRMPSRKNINPLSRTFSITGRIRR
jgi:hypothetical protein